MKYIKKLIGCILIAVLLNGNMALHVDAAETAEETVHSMMYETSITTQKNGIIAVFTFDYVDGSFATFVGCSVNAGTVRVTKDVFHGDSRIVEVVVTFNNKDTTIGAWCNIYGQTGII